jgi:rubrerythrin
VAAQQLAGEGFKKVINLKGGIKGWDGYEAVGKEDQGIELFEDLGSAEDILTTAYSLEQGLQDFYLRMMQQVSAPEVITLFRKLADIEDIHKERIFEEYTRLTGLSDLVAFEKNLEEDVVEGGMTTEEYSRRFNLDFDKADEVIGLAMSIEAQAFDLYTRAARRTEDGESRKVLERIAGEEKYHLEQLGSLLDNVLESAHG